MRTFAVTAISLAALAAAPALAQTAPPTQPQQPPAVESMNRQQLRDEVTRLRAIVQGGAVRAQRPAGCTSAEHRQFDFWVGEWDVMPSGGSGQTIIAESSITLIDQGCVIMEEWRPFRGAHGHSLNMYDTADSKWHQTWMAASGLRTEYAGTFENGAMYLDALTPLPGVPANARSRMNFQQVDANTVRQWGEQFDDAAQRWNVTWDLTYRRRANSRP